MQLKRVVMLLLAVIVMAGGCKPNTKEPKNNQPEMNISDPLVYDSKIIGELTQVNQGLFGILEQISAADSVGIVQQYYRTIQQLDEADEKLRALPAMNGNSDYKNAALKIVEFHRGAMDKQYKRIIEISVKKKPTTRQEEERETLYEQMENVEEKLDERFLRVREKFGKDNKVELPKDADLQL